MKTLVVVRHSFCESDSEELTALGNDCVDVLAVRLQDVTAWKLGLVLTSPKGWAVNTAIRLAAMLRYPHQQHDCLYSADGDYTQLVRPTLDLIQQNAVDNEVIVVVTHDPFVGQLVARFAYTVLGEKWVARSFLQTEGVVINFEQRTIAEVSGL
jgi:phosphohistidine phosphatase SixA